MPGLLRSLPLLRSAARLAAPSFQSYRNQNTQGYYILLPEIYEENPEVSVFTQQEGVPQYKNIKGDLAFKELSMQILQYENSLFLLEEKLDDKDYPRTFETTLGEVDKLQIPLRNAWNMLEHLTMIKNEKDLSDAVHKLKRRYLRSLYQQYQSQKLYEVVKEFQKDIAKFAPDQQQVIERYKRECKVAGLDLNSDGRTAIAEYTSIIGGARETYISKLSEATQAFKHHMSEADMKNFPEYLLHHFATSSGFIATLLEPQYSIFLTYCGDRQQRWNIYHGRAIRCSINCKELYTVDQVESMRVKRHYMAETLGFRNFADYMSALQSAPSVDFVYKFLLDLSDQIAPVADRQLGELREFCAEKGFKVPLERWDLHYWRRRYREAKLAIDPEEFEQLFTLPAVLEGLVRLVDKYFGVELREVRPKAPLWTNDVIMMRVAYDGKEVGTIFLDLHARSEKRFQSSCTVISAGSLANGVQPSAAITMSLNRSTHVTMAELGELLQSLGSALRHTLSQARYSAVSGINALPHDVRKMAPDFFRMLLLDKNVARTLSLNESLPDDIHEKMRRQTLHLYAVDLQFELYKSLIDLELHSTKDFSEDIVKKCYTRIVKCFPWHYHETFIFNNFWEPIIGGYQACYYSKVWGTMLAAEVFQAMRESPEDDMHKVSKRFCKLMLVEGGCESNTEAFRKFRGRDPTVDSFLTISDLK